MKQKPCKTKLNHEVQNLYSENYKALQKELKKT